MSQTLLVTGGTGYLGSRIIELAQHSDTHATFFCTPPPRSVPATFHRCDLREPDRFGHLVSSLQPDIIIHTACSNKTSEEIDAIVPAARQVSKAAHQFSLKLVHLSSDVVFDGTAAPYREEDLPNPLHTYGQAKAEAEKIVATTCPTAIIVRSSLMYGIDPFDHQTRWLIEGMDRKEGVRLFTDEVRSPIWVNTLAKAILELTTTEFQGFLHLAGPEALNRWDFGLAILKLTGRNPTRHVRPSTIEEAGMNRPKNLALNIDKARRVLNTRLDSISEVTQQLQQVES